MFTYTELTITFKNRKAAEAAKTIATKALRESNFGYEYEEQSSELMAADLTIKGNELVLDEYNGYFYPEDILPVLKAIWEKIAREMPDETFTAWSFTECDCSTIEVEAVYENKALRINSYYIDNCETGYVCPHCGFVFAGLGAIFDEDEEICDECGETFNINDCEIIDGDRQEEVIIIA